MDRPIKRRLLLCAYVVLVFAENTVTEALHDSPDSLASGVRRNASSAERALATAANRLARQFTEASVEQLGLTALNEVVASLHTGPRVLADEDLVLAVSQRLGAKLGAAIRLLADLQRRVPTDGSARSFTHPCPLDSLDKIPRLRDTESGSATLRPAAGKSDGVEVKRQYFLAVADGATDALCGRAATRTPARRLFHRTLQPRPKQLLLALDTARASRAELHLAFSVARELLAALQPSDSVGLLFVGAKLEIVQLDKDCDGRNPSMGSATDKNKELLMKYLNGAEIEDTPSDVEAAVQEALDMFTALPFLENPMMVYIGVEPPSMQQVINNVWSSRLHKKVFFSTCDVNLNKNANMSITNSSKTEFSGSSSIFQEGRALHFNSSLTAGQMATLLLLTLPVGSLSEGVVAAPPLWDPAQRDLLVPLVLAHEDLGMLAVELYVSDLAEDIIYFIPFTPRQRIFIMDFKGRVVMHSTYSRPEVIVSKPRLMDISFLETASEFFRVKFNMLHNSSGKTSIRTNSTDTIYTWKWIKQLYIVCVVSEVIEGTGSAGNRGGGIASGVARELQYHRIDLLPPTDSVLCRHFKQVSTIERGTLYLSPSSFRSPFLYLHDIKNGRDISFTLMQSYMAYLKDNTRLLSNPGLKAEVRNDVGILYPMLSYFKRQHIHGAYNKYIVRRYAATEHGVLVMFPGSILESDFEPNRKAWFTRALRNPGKVVLTPPYLDVGGAGYIVSVSHAVLDPANNFKPTLVVSMDMTMGFLYKILLESLPLCSSINVKCFIMDDRGYLMSHPGLLDPSGSGPIEQQHITHKESLIANDMLNHHGFVQKKLCKNYGDGTVQRFYEFNNSINTVLTNLVHGEHCARYHITAIPGTNAFVGMVNSTCNLGAFCPCSVVDRLCLNCNRMEQNECECPCECTLPDTSTCQPQVAPGPAAPLCDSQPEGNNHKNHFFYNLATHLKSCFDFQCESYTSQSACLGVLGCEWCQLDTVTETTLAAPFCSAQAACFNGVLGAVTPYGEGSLGHVTQDDLLATYSAVGPIAGCIVALCLILAIAVYCYKQNLTVADDADAYVATSPETWPETGVQMSHLASEDDIHDDRSGHQDKLLLAEEPIAPVSPYRILTGYRRPNTTGESDHGYSTMTPHDDSEHLAFALVEPFLTGAASSPSSSRRGSAPEPLTLLPCGKNNVLAPVTVHRHMEAT